MENKVVKEFRLNVEGGFKSPYVISGLRSISKICYEYARYIREKEPLKLPSTNILRFDFAGHEWENWNNGPTSYGIWALRFYINEIEFEKFEDEKKIIFISDLIAENLIRLFDIQGLERQLIFDAQEKIKANNYYIKGDDFRNRNRRTICWLEYLSGYHEIKIRFCYKNKNEEVRKINVCAKEYYDPILWNKLDVFEQLEIPTYLKIEGWRNTNEFVMTWGKEEYIFYLDKEKIVLNILE